MKRKRYSLPASSRKRLKSCSTPTTQTRHNRVLTTCYPVILTLRAYLRVRLPAKSTRRKHLSTPLGLDIDTILDGWTVGVLEEPSSEVRDARSKDFAAFTQTQTRASLSQSGQAQTCHLDDVLDFVVWQLFNQCGDRSRRPSHVLCCGLQRGLPHEGSPVAPGIVCIHPNGNLVQLKSSSWQNIFTALGADGEPILTSLLLDCGLFAPLDSGEDNFYQISGVPIHEVKGRNELNDAKSKDTPGLSTTRSPSAITFVRNRVFYAKPSLNGQGLVRFGLKHIHVLQRYTDSKDDLQTIHILKHIFPRHFSFHNVFTSEVDKKLTSHPFLDYVYREDEISAQTLHPQSWLPRRLRGRILDLAKRLRAGHARCSYAQLLRHYCTLHQVDQNSAHLGSHEIASLLQSGSTGFISQLKAVSKPSSMPPKPEPARSKEHSFLAYATPATRVAAFCKAVFRVMLPIDIFGIGEDGQQNWKAVLQQIEVFVQLRRFESMTLHHICQHMRPNCIEWLVPSNMSVNQKSSQQDRDKRLQLLWELMYYLFDSLLIPLIQTNFYVTETGTQRNRLFYFRHDVWRKLAEPSLHNLRSNTYQQLQPAEVKRMLNSRSLGYSHVRLLPKSEGTRTITNLRRRMGAIVKGRRVLGPSINAQLVPILGALTTESRSTYARMGGAILSVSGLHERLRRFQSSIPSGSKLYFAKVDVQSCFDSIPQESLLTMIRDVFASNAYRTTKYVETKPMSNTQARKRYLNLARPADTEPAFSKERAEELCLTKTGRVLSEVGYQKVWSKSQLLDLLQQHVRNNVVKIGKKHFRQTEGIPQGSVLSSLLCSFFYTHFEQHQLNFLDASNALLVRLIDDFLLITTELSSARKFLTAMSAPPADYGIVVRPDKTLANFEAAIGGQKVPRNAGRSFPYCGIIIDTANLQIGKDRQKKDCIIGNGLTVDMTKNAGVLLERKVRLSFVQQMHKMMLDKDINTSQKRLLNIMEACHETAMKMFRYIHGMRSDQPPSSGTIIRIFDHLGHTAVKYGQSTIGSDDTRRYEMLSRAQILWALADAFIHVFSRKQSRFRRFINHVESLRRRNQVAHGISSKQMRSLVAQRDAVFVDYVY